MLFHLYYLMSCKKVYVVNKALYYYRYNELSATNNYINNLWEILMNQLELVEDGLNKFNLLNSKSKDIVFVNDTDYRRAGIALRIIQQRKQRILFTEERQSLGFGRLLL